MRHLAVFVGLVFIFSQAQACKPRNSYRLSGESSASLANDEVNLVYINQFVLPMYQMTGLLSSLNDEHPHLKRLIDIMRKTTSPIVKSTAASALIAIVQSQSREINWKRWFPSYDSPSQLMNDVVKGFVNAVNEPLGRSTNPSCPNYIFRSCGSHEQCEYNVAALARIVDIDANQPAIDEKFAELQADTRCLDQGIAQNILQFKLDAAKLWKKFYTVTDYQTARDSSTYPTGEPGQVNALKNEVQALLARNQSLLKMQNSTHYFKIDVVRKLFGEKFYQPDSVRGAPFAKLIDSFLAEASDIQSLIIDRMKYYLQKADDTFNGMTRLSFLASRVNVVNLTPWLNCVRDRVDTWRQGYDDEDPYAIISARSSNQNCPAVTLTPKQGFELLAGNSSPDNLGMSYIMRELKGAWRDEYVDLILHTLASIPTKDRTLSATGAQTVEEDQAAGLQSYKNDVRKSILDFFKGSHITTTLLNNEKTIASRISGFSSWHKQIENTQEVVNIQSGIVQAKQAIVSDKNADSADRRAALKLLDQSQRLMTGTNLKYYCYDYLFSEPGYRSRSSANVAGQPAIEDGLRMPISWALGKCWVGSMMALDTEKVVRGLIDNSTPLSLASAYQGMRLGDTAVGDVAVNSAEYFFKYYGLENFNKKKDPFETACLGEYNNGGFAPPDANNNIPLSKLCQFRDSQNPNIASSATLEKRLGCYIRANASYDRCVELSSTVEMEILSTAVMMASGSIAFRGIAAAGSLMMRGRKIATIGEKITRAGYKMSDVFTKPAAFALLAKEATLHSPLWIGKSLAIGAAFSTVNRVALKVIFNVPLYDPAKGLKKNVIAIAQEIGVGAIFMGIMPGFDRLTAGITSKIISRMPQSSRAAQKQLAFWVPALGEYGLDVTLEKNLMMPLWKYFDADDQMWMQNNNVYLTSLKNTFVFRAVSARVDVKHILENANAHRIMRSYETTNLMQSHTSLLGQQQNLLLDLGITDLKNLQNMQVSDINVHYQKMVDDFYFTDKTSHEMGLDASQIAHRRRILQKAQAAYNQLSTPQQLQEFLRNFRPTVVEPNTPPVMAQAVFDHAA